MLARGEPSLPSGLLSWASQESGDICVGSPISQGWTKTPLASRLIPLPTQNHTLVVEGMLSHPLNLSIELTLRNESPATNDMTPLEVTCQVYLQPKRV